MSCCKSCWNEFNRTKSATQEAELIKKCTRCKVDREISLFFTKKTNKDGKDNKCKSCHKKYSQERWKNKS